MGKNIDFHYRKLSDIIPEGMSKEMFLIRGAYDAKFWIDNVFCDELTGGPMVVQPFQMEWLNALKVHKNIAINSFRGSGKTQLLVICYTLWKMWYGDREKIVILSSARERANELISMIRGTIEANELLKDLIPPTRESTWKADHLVMNNNNWIKSKAFNIKAVGDRPTLLIADEFDTLEDLHLWNKIATSVELGQGTTMAISTPQKSNGLLRYCTDSKHYWSKTYSVIEKLEDLKNPNAKTLWPAKYSIPHLKTIRAKYGEHNFLTEYMCRFVAEAEKAVFPAELINSALDVNMRFNAKPLKDSMRHVSGDFAIASGPTADFDAYWVGEKIGDKIIIKYGERHKGLLTPVKVDRLETLYKLHSAMDVACDPSHIGSEVVRRLREKSIPVLEAEMHSAARAGLIVGLKSAFDSGRIILPYDPECEVTRMIVDRLALELLGFTESKNPSGTMVYKSTADHDDLAISLMILVKACESQQGCLDW